MVFLAFWSLQGHRFAWCSGGNGLELVSSSPTILERRSWRNELDERAAVGQACSGRASPPKAGINPERLRRWESTPEPPIHVWDSTG